MLVDECVSLHSFMLLYVVTVQTQQTADWQLLKINVWSSQGELWLLGCQEYLV